ncbi:MAG TPA: quinol:cytochrome C oxidoreductase [Phycisphaerae bacterium]|nr:quinol:cytochrome C oxidoreductase [Phycisphaerae bacterium]
MIKEPINIFEENRRLGLAGGRLLRAATVVGLIGLILAAVLAFFVEHGAERFFHSYLVSFCYFLSLALGALFFVVLQHLTRSGWSVVVRRLAEGIAGSVALLAILAVVVVLGMGYLYHWTDPDTVAGDQLLQWKRPYLHPTFFVIRLGVYFAVWVLLARFFFNNSVRQDETGDVALTLRMQWFSAPAMVLLAVTLTFASFDLLMSLEPHWYSTIFGVYYFAGGVVGFFGLIALTGILVQRSGRLTRAINEEHYQDVGKLIFAFVVFWAYIAFSQYMLIWYANIPEETTWYLDRQSGGWAAVSLVLLFGHFVVPFLALISRQPKRHPRILVAAAVWVLVMHWIDIYWLVMPGTRFADGGRVPFHVMDLLCFIGLGGLFVAAVVHRLQGHSLIAQCDPRLPESLSFENV